MSKGPLQRAHLWIAGFSFMGVVASHLVGYWVAVPEAGERHEVLAATGHHYWVWFVALSFAAFVAAMCRFTIGSLRDEPPGHASRNSLKTVAARFVAWQLPVLLLLEAAERLVVDGHLHVFSLMTEAPVVLGVLVQFLVAIVGALFIVFWARVVSGLAGRRDTFHGERRAASWPESVNQVWNHRAPAGPKTLRGPPLPS